MSRGRSGRAVVTWASGAAYTAITLLVGLVATPQVVRFIGESRFGAFRTVSDWMGYLLLADLGLGTAFGVALVRASGTGPEECAAVVRQALRLLGRMTALTFPLALALAWFMPHLIRDGWQSAFALRASAGVIAIGLVLGPLLVFRSYLEATQRGYLVNVALLAQSLIVTACSVLFAWNGFGLVGQSVAGLLGLVMFVGLIAAWSMPLLNAHPSTGRSPMAAREVWSLSWPLAAAAAGNRLNLMTDTIVVGKLLGVGDVAMLFLTQRIILLCAGQVNALASSSWAALAELRHSGQTTAFGLRLGELTRLMVGAGLVLVGSVAAFSRDFVTLWVGPQLYAGDLLCLATLGSVIVFAFMLPYSWAIDVAGDARLRLLPSTIGSVLNLALSVVFVKRWGVAGVALGTLCAYLLTDAWYCPLLVSRRYGVRLEPVVRAASRGLGVGLPWVALVWILPRVRTVPVTWTAFITQAAVVGVAALVYCWFLVMNPKDRIDWSHRLRTLVA